MKTLVLECCDSTNDRLKLLARQEGFRPPLALIAREQTAGRGRLGRRWVSPPGGIYFSLITEVAAPAEQWGGLPLVIALAVRESLVRTGAKVGIKWPNDILGLSEAGSILGKLSGILVEMLGMGASRLAIIGVGINVTCPDGALAGGSGKGLAGVEGGRAAGLAEEPGGSPGNAAGNLAGAEGGRVGGAVGGLANNPASFNPVYLDSLGKHRLNACPSDSGRFAPAPPGQAPPLPQVVAAPTQTNLGQADSESDGQAFIGNSLAKEDVSDPMALAQSTLLLIQNYLSQWASSNYQLTPFLRAYLRHLTILGKKVSLRNPQDTSDSELAHGTVSGIGEHGELLLTTADGQTLVFTSGEVTLRMIK